jgi:hypothetical protein
LLANPPPNGTAASGNLAEQAVGAALVYRVSSH